MCERKRTLDRLLKSISLLLHPHRQNAASRAHTDPCTSTMTPENSLLLKRKGCLPGSTFRDVLPDAAPDLPSSGMILTTVCSFFAPLFPWWCITPFQHPPGFTGAFPLEFSPFPLSSSLSFVLRPVFLSHSAGVLHSHSLSLCMCNMTNRIWPKLSNFIMIFY